MTDMLTALTVISNNYVTVKWINLLKN